MKTERYRAARQDLLDRITASLASDPRFCAAWLGGSFGRGEADDLSDIDLAIAVHHPCSEALCAHTAPVAAGAHTERLDLFRQFGEPAVIHENHHNAPPGGTFTFVLYRLSALVVDWTLIPCPAAIRPAQTVLLFDHAGIPIEQPASPADPLQRAEMASERVAFFWMIAAAAGKPLFRRDAAAFYELLGMLHGALADTRRLLAGHSPGYGRRPSVPLAGSHSEQISMLRHACKEMNALMAAVARLGGCVPDSPMQPIDILLDLAED